MNHRRTTLVLSLWAALLLGALPPDLCAASPTSAQEIFEHRIMPIFKSPQPSSCTECHLAGVDLKNYILPSHEKTFLSLRDQGLIDLNSPADSKILRLIAMGGGTNHGVTLIPARVRAAEYAAFAEWVKASAQDPKLRDAPKLKPRELARPARPNEVIRHARADRVLVSFEENFWSQRFRCSGCHSAAGGDNKKLVEEHGQDVTWLKETPEATLQYLAGSDNINIEKPNRSRLLLKPLNEIKHGGGQKMMRGDMTYKAFRAFLEDYAKTLKNEYVSAAELPSRRNGPKVFASDHWLKLNNTPPDWAERLLQVTLYAWDAVKGDWERDPVAMSDRSVWGKGKLWQHTLTLLAPAGSERARLWQTKPTLSGGRYLLKVHVDRGERLKSDWTAPLGDADFVGQAVVEIASWPSGYGAMTLIEADKIQK